MGDFGFGGFGDLGGIGDWLTRLIQDILSALAYIWNVLVAVAQYLYDILVAVAQALVNFLVATEKALVHFFENLYPTIIQPLISELVKIEHWLAGLYDSLIKPLVGELVKLEHWVHDVLAPVVKWVKIAQAWYNKYILPWQLRMQQIVSIARKFLSVFRLFGAKWATKLDADFAKVQSYITTSIVDVVATLNGVVSWLQLISDPTQILRKAFWQSTAFTGATEIFKAANLGGLKPVSAADRAQGQANLSLMNPSTPPVTAGPNNTATLSPAMQDIQAKMLAALPDYNPTVNGYTGPVQA